jgi:hypothetical protein
MNDESIGQRALRKTKSFMKKLFLIVLLVALAVFAFLYWGTYETGVMAGKVVRVSEKGMIFKTFEGKLSLETFGALKGTSPIAETFDFSVEKSEDAVIQNLQQVALSGERVNLYFKKRYMTFPWRGDTNYFVTRVERLQ